MNAVVRLSHINERHEAMINYMITHPGYCHGDLSEEFGYSRSHVSIILRSEVFRARVLERTQELVDPVLRANVQEQLRVLLDRSVDILMQKLDKPSDEVPDQLVLRTLELSTRALGLGNKDEVSVRVDVHHHLEDLGNRLVGLLQRKKLESLSGSSSVIDVPASN